MHPILVVDDEQAIAMLIRRILTDAGYRCEAVTDSIKAADLLEKKQYDLVLLDIMMPQIDGYDLLNYIRPTGTPCIFITAKAAVEDRVRGLHSGADDYIVKPFAPAELVARVESVLRRAGRSMVVYHLWDLTVDTAACRIQRGDEEIRLTPKEYELTAAAHSTGTICTKPSGARMTLPTAPARWIPISPGCAANCIWATACVPCAMWVICWKKSKIVAKVCIPDACRKQNRDIAAVH